MKFTHPIRIYRPGFYQLHDLSPEMVNRDIYSGDVWGRLMPDEESVVIPGDMGMVAQTAQIAFPKGVDVSVGYILFVGVPRVRDGRREMTETELSENAIVGQVELSVEYSGGFAAGQKVGIEDNEHTHYGKLKSADRRQLTLYVEDQLQYDFDAGTVVRAGTYFTIIGRRYPADYGNIQLVNVRETGGVPE